jgi:16S rRNA (adenine1518-N6/adenine1519-N6)-dimethyltransferase
MDTGTSARIARLAVDAPGDRVLEVGAGTGSLTLQLLAAGADLTVFDLDDSLVEILRGREDLAGAVIQHGDALAYDYAEYAGDRPWRVAGNLPYNIATPLMIKLAQMERPPDRLVAMIQKDVADRLLAKPGTAAYGSLTVALALTMRVERAFNVSPGQFFPRPKVVSTVVVLHRLETPAAPVADRKRFEQVVRGAFAYRRKTLANSLSLALEMPRERVETALAAIDLDADIRGETLDLATFARLTDALDD